MSENVWYGETEDVPLMFDESTRTVYKLFRNGTKIEIGKGRATTYGELELKCRRISYEKALELAMKEM